MNSPQEKETKRVKKLLKLFLNTLYISAFTFGGGFVIVSLMKRKFVDDLHWIDDQEMLDMTAMAQSCPGAIAVNAAILVGWNIGGFIGMIVAVLGTIIPPLIILTGISFIYSAFATNTYVALVLAGMQAGVAAVVLDVVCSLGIKVAKTKRFIYIIEMTVAFVLTFFFDINVIYIILGAVVLGILLEVISHYRRKKTDDIS